MLDNTLVPGHLSYGACRYYPCPGYGILIDMIAASAVVSTLEGEGGGRARRRNEDLNSTSNEDPAPTNYDCSRAHIVEPAYSATRSRYAKSISTATAIGGAYLYRTGNAIASGRRPERSGLDGPLREQAEEQ
jgi:hypothetical protein